MAAETVPLNFTFCETNVAGKPTSAVEAAGETVMAGVVVGFIVVRSAEVPVKTLLPTVIVDVPVANESHVGAVPSFKVTPDVETEVIFDHVGATDHALAVIAVFESAAAPSMDDRETVRLVGVAGL